MKVYQITIQPQSGFGTPLKGDTLFGHLCWQLVYDRALASLPIEDVLKQYPERPFAVFSSAVPLIGSGEGRACVFRTPPLQLDRLFDLPEDRHERIKKRKEYKARRWMLLHSDTRIDSFRAQSYLSDEELFNRFFEGADPGVQRSLMKCRTRKFVVDFSQPHNTINRRTNATGEAPFAPYVAEQTVFAPGAELALFAGIDEEMMGAEQLLEGLGRIGASGFGRDASTGLGRFQVIGSREVSLSDRGAQDPNACYTLGPCVPQRDFFSDAFFLPFTRFGRHGDALARSGQPFKAPVVMADEGAVFTTTDTRVFDQPWIGTAVQGISKAEPDTVMQGYSLYLPVRMEG